MILFHSTWASELKSNKVSPWRFYSIEPGLIDRNLLDFYLFGQINFNLNKMNQELISYFIGNYTESTIW